MHSQLTMGVLFKVRQINNSKHFTKTICFLLLAYFIVWPGRECWADSPKNMIVMAKALDDLITLDPAEAFEFSGTEILANVYERLFKANPEDPSYPTSSLVSEWHRSDDGLEYRFSIRKGMVFESGRQLTAEDVVFSIRRAVFLNKTPAFILNRLGLNRENVDQNVRVLSEASLALVVDRPYSSSLVLNVLSSVVTSIVDRDVVMQHAKNGDWGAEWLRSHTAGSGVFRVTNWKVGEYLVLERREAHASPINRIVIMDIREPATQRLMLTRADIDIARDLTPDHITALSAAEGIVAWSANQARIFYLALNQKHPALANPLVRRAVRIAIDYQGIANHLLRGSGIVHQAFLPLGFDGVLADIPFSMDLDGARQLINESGEIENLKLQVDIRSDPKALQIAQALQTTFREIGIELDIRPSD